MTNKTKFNVPFVFNLINRLIRISVMQEEVNTELLGKKTLIGNAYMFILKLIDFLLTPHFF